jgi:hypothetical protein
MHTHRHGGSVIITPASNDDWRRAVDVRFGVTSASSRTLSERFVEVESARTSGDKQALDAQMALFYKELKNVGKLTAVDGALLMREDLAVLGFGAKLNCDPVDCVVRRLNAITREMRIDCPLAELGGTRHQSAARFVNQHRDCSAVVSSQDGRLTLISWLRNPGTVIAISGLEHFVWGELP